MDFFFFIHLESDAQRKQCKFSIEIKAYYVVIMWKYPFYLSLLQNRDIVRGGILL